MAHASDTLTASEKEPRDWVMFRLSALGDLALTTGVLRFWHQTRGWRFIVITKEANAPIFEGNPAVREVISLGREDLSLFRLIPLFRALAIRFAGCGLLDWHGTLRSRLLSLLWKGPVRRYRKFGLARRLFLLSGGRWFKRTLLRWNVPQRYASALESSPPDRALLLPCIFLSEAETAQGQALLASLPQGKPDAGQPLVALHPYATHPDKAWKDASWRELMVLLERKGIPWFVVGRGTPLPGIPEGRDFTNRTSLRETCALLRAASVLVTGDSGPMHLAGGVGTPVVALFGPTTQAWGFFPAGPRDRVLEASLSCRPCTLHGKKNCDRDHACMRAISPALVMAALESGFTRVSSGVCFRDD